MLLFVALGYLSRIVLLYWYYTKIVGELLGGGVIIISNQTAEGWLVVVLKLGESPYDRIHQQLAGLGHHHYLAAHFWFISTSVMTKNLHISAGSIQFSD